MTDVTEAAIDVAATWRITRLVMDDEITRPLREAVTYRWPESKAAYLVACPYCVSVWAGAVVQILPRPLRWTLGLSGGTMLVKWAAELAEAAVGGE